MSASVDDASKRLHCLGYVAHSSALEEHRTLLSEDRPALHSAVE
jgi:hypothetical protein